MRVLTGGGGLRYGTVGISGTDYVPDIPKRQTVIKDIDNILTSKESVTKKAIHLFLYSCRSQLFWDGNKGTSLISANKYLISNGKGILTIPEKHLIEFTNKLTIFYNTNDYSRIEKFIYNNCIMGMTIDKNV